MSETAEGIEENQNESDKEIPYTEYQVTSEVTAFTRGEAINGSTGLSLTEQGDVVAIDHSSTSVPLTEKVQISVCNIECLNKDRKVQKIKGKEEEEKEEEEEDDDLFECHLGANGQVVLWSPHWETILSRFDFVSPLRDNKKESSNTKSVTVDDDGDACVIRKRDLDKKEEVLIIEHQSATTLHLVGEQVWSGALYLADFILHNPTLFENKNILELASGVGLTSIVAGMFAKHVTVTDIDRGDILDLIRRNMKRNAEFVSADVEVKEIDFTNPSTIDALQENLKDVSVIIAADVIYDNPLTDAFLDALLRLMSEPPDKTLYMAMEKRYVFTMEDMDSMAPCYEYLLTRLDWLCCQNLSRVEWTLDLLETPFEQYFTYERNKHLIIFKITSKLKNGENGAL